jgi:hypothetical protein
MSAKHSVEEILAHLETQMGVSQAEGRASRGAGDLPSRAEGCPCRRVRDDRPSLRGLQGHGRHGGRDRGPYRNAPQVVGPGPTARPAGPPQPSRGPPRGGDPGGRDLPGLHPGRGGEPPLPGGPAQARRLPARVCRSAAHGRQGHHPPSRERHGAPGGAVHERVIGYLQCDIAIDLPRLS